MARRLNNVVMESLLSRVKKLVERLEIIVDEAEGDCYIPQAITMVVYLRNQLEAI